MCCVAVAVVAAMANAIVTDNGVVALPIRIVLVLVAQEADAIAADVLAAFVEAFVGVKVLDVERVCTKTADTAAAGRHELIAELGVATKGVVAAAAAVVARCSW